MSQEREQAEQTSQAQPTAFDALYGPLAKDVFREIVREELGKGSDAAELARAYAAKGKPDFVLAYLLAAPLTDEEKRDLLAHAYDQRATNTEQRAREFDRKFHRSFPMLLTDAGNDRATAKQIRAGRAIRPGAGRQLPMV